ncbi:tail fiber domain-containing protein [Burkholderia multivorans]|uniref:tail fiber domain-containing protein n=1 Tax=Burkholderia multivorans TaxID=87883 RepID=UPI000D0212EC|nr:tail fiber domain-containing protein [Burkholderia multivorans]PRH46124.1 hypothetical protein C6V05_22660 [Burkholderia multivorans]
MAIIGNLPNTLSNGTTADATQVMADFNYIVNQVNANAMPASPGSFTMNGTLAILSTVLPIALTNTTAGASILKLTGNGATTPNKYVGVLNGSFVIYSDNGSTGLLSLDNSGNMANPGNITAGGIVNGSNITGTSDERLKKNWKPFAPDFLEQVAAIVHGTYTRKDTGERRVGVGAQSLRRILPEAVFGDEVLSVAEGSAALAIVIELTREVLRLRSLLETAK